MQKKHQKSHFYQYQSIKTRAYLKHMTQTQKTYEKRK